MCRLSRPKLRPKIADCGNEPDSVCFGVLTFSCNHFSIQSGVVPFAFFERGEDAGPLILPLSSALNEGKCAMISDGTKSALAA